MPGEFEFEFEFEWRFYADLSVHSRTRQPPDHDDRPKSEDQL